MAALERVARTWGTPCYAYDLGRLRLQVEHLRRSLPAEVEILYSLKANPSLGLCRAIAAQGLGADVVSSGELAVALEAGFPEDRLFASGPYKSPEMLARLRELPAAVLSVDSGSELAGLEREESAHRVILRLRPEFVPSAVMATGPGSRFGMSLDEVARQHGSVLRIAGFHVFAGSQVLDTGAVVAHLRASLELSLWAADRLGREPEILNLGGGFGVPYGAGQAELDLGPIAEELGKIIEQVAPARIVLELGRYVVAQSGWYLTRVVAHQSHGGRRAVVVDGGVHQRADLCGLDLRGRAIPPLVLTRAEGAVAPTDVLGCLCLTNDVLAEASALPALALGALLAFPNAGAYGYSASPLLFLSHPRPRQVAFESERIEPLDEEAAVPQAGVRSSFAKPIDVDQVQI